MLDVIYQKIKDAKKIIILRHQNADPDAIGSQYGLQAILQKSFPKKQVKCAGEIPDTLQYLANEEQIDDSFYQNALALVLDTANQERIDGNFELLLEAKEVIKIDHHPNKDHYTEIEYVDTNASSTSEIIYDFYEQFKTDLILNDKAARLLYAGLVGDTGRFLHPNTTARTFYVASKLREYSFDFIALNREFLERSKEQVYLAGYVQTHFKINDEGVAYIILTNDLLNKYHVTHDETASLVGLLGTIRGVESWAMFLEKADQPGVYRCRLRSKVIPIEPIARRHDGGGHQLASGANAYSMEEIQEIIEEMTENIIEAKKN